MRYDVTCPQGHRAQIEKPMDAAYPACATCGQPTARVFTAAPAVHFAAGGFYRTETQFERLVGPQRAARFARRKADIEARARAGKLTAYERALEAA